MNAFTPMPYNRFSTRGGGVQLRAKPGEFIDLDVIQQNIPSVFAEAKHDSRSERYVFADTREVLGGLLSEDFGIVAAQQGGSRIEGKADFTKHMLRLRHRSQDAAVQPAVGDTVYNEIILMNSHDGTSSYRLAAGVFRLVCLNGMVAGEMFAEHRIGHTKRSLREDVIEAAYKVVQDFPRITDEMSSFAGIELSGPERLAFAEAARELRFTPDDNRVAPATLLQARRSFDAGADLWRTMNVVQENLIRGGQHYTTPATPTRRSQNRTVGAVNGVDQDRAINRALWTLTEKMRELKAA